MSAVIKASVALAVAVAVVTVLWAVVGLHENPLAGIGFLVLAIGLNVAAVFWALSQTAPENGYLKQLLNGALLGVVAGVLIMVSSILITSVLFPNYLEEAKAAGVDFLSTMNLPEDQLDQQIAKIESATAFSQARDGAIGTFFTSLVVGAIVAIFKRKK